MCIKDILCITLAVLGDFPSASVKGNGYSEFVHQPWCIHAVEHYFNIKRNAEMHNLDGCHGW